MTLGLIPLDLLKYLPVMKKFLGLALLEDNKSRELLIILQNNKKRRQSEDIDN